MLGHEPPAPLYGSEGYWLTIVAAMALVLAGARRDRRWRPGWVLIALGMLSWLVGDIYNETALGALATPPLPSWADLGYLGFVPFIGAGLVTMIGRRDPDLPESQVIDGLSVALALNAISAWLVVQPLLDAERGDALERATVLAYPLLDAVLLGIVGVGAAARGWRCNRRWTAIGAALVGFWIADSAYVVQVARDTYTSPSVTDIGWMLCFVLLAAAATMNPDRPPPADRADARQFLVPTGFALSALAVLTAAAALRLNIFSIAFASASLATVLSRLALALRENATFVREARSDANTDHLTGLGNRRALTCDLGRRLDEATPFELAMFDLNGFKAYNDRFGHLAGDELLIRLAGRLAEAVADGGRAYRPGGDEYVVIVGSGRVDQIEAGLQALTETGPGYRVTASHGSVRLPAEASTVTLALTLADTRMYRSKGLSRLSGRFPGPAPQPHVR
jgi:diguanylate cyclase (GGDEF)-like protein